jgi:hypothetical protein
MISDVSITKKYVLLKTPTTVGKASGRRNVWDVEYTQDGEVCHALFSTEDEARRYATTRLGYTG